MPAIPFDAMLQAIQNAADAGAFGFGKQTRPTEAQLMAGNYAKGRINWQGLPLVIEQPRGTYREGKGWRNLMAAHYGYIAGTRGNDGDEVDCFIGTSVDSTRVYVVNQVLRGRFDEHKVMLCYDSEEAARDAYLRSYSRGWPGLDSIAALSLSKFKWWLKNGDLTKPLSADNLPYEGTEPMNRVYWTADAEPIGQNLDKLMYGLRQHDGAAGLLLDSVSVADIHGDPENEAVLSMDAMVTPFNRLQPKMNVLRAVMERSGGEVKPVAVQVSEPFKQRGTVNVAAVFELSDGQTVTVYFHNPDSTPAKLAPGDELISWKWLLNKKDVTIVVAPERGQDLNIREVARRLMRLADKNSPAFQRANAKRAERMGAIQSLTDEVAALEGTLASEQNRLEVVKLHAEEMQTAGRGLPQGWGLRRDVETGQYRATYLGDDYSVTGEAGDFATAAEAAAAAQRWAAAAEAARLEAEANKPPAGVAEADRYDFKSALSGFDEWIEANAAMHATAVAMDKAAIAAGARVQWFKPGAAMDSAYSLDSGMAHAIAALAITGSTAANNAPIHAAEGDAAQAALSTAVAMSAEEATDVLERYEAGELVAITRATMDAGSVSICGSILTGVASLLGTIDIDSDGSAMAYADPYATKPVHQSRMTGDDAAQLVTLVVGARNGGTTIPEGVTAEEMAVLIGTVAYKASYRPHGVMRVTGMSGMTYAATVQGLNEAGKYLKRSAITPAGKALVDAFMADKYGSSTSKLDYFKGKFAGEPETVADPVPAQPTFAVGEYLTALFPSLNKQPSIEKYKERPSGTTSLGKVEKVLSLTADEYDEFANNLMASNPALGDGGSASDHPLITDELFKRSLSDWTAEQQAAWRTTSYVLVTVVQAPGRETFVVDAQGYDYARYVGLNPAPAAAPVVKAAPVKAADPIEVDDHKALAEFTRVRITSVGNENLYFADPNGVEYYTKLVEPDDYKVDQWVSMADDRAVKEAIASQSPAPAEDGSVTVDGFTYTVDTSDGYMVTFTAPETVRGLKLWAREEDAINAKIQEAIEMVKNSPHLEKRWNSKYGEVTHVALADMPTLGEGSELYYVVYNNGAFVKKVRASEFDEVMRQEAYEATPEGAAAIEADRAKRAEESAAIAAQREAAEKAAKDRKESLEAMVNEWLNTTSYTSVQKGSSRSILLREAIYPEFDSAVLARVEFVQRVVEGGAKTDVRQINRIKDKSRAQFNRMDNREQQEHERKVREGGTVSEYWLGNYTITKTEYDYANYLIGAKAAEPSPAKESTVTDNPDAATLRAIIDGTTDPLTANLEALEAIYERNADNAEIQALFEQAVNVVIEAENKATASV